MTAAGRVAFAVGGLTDQMIAGQGRTLTATMDGGASLSSATFHEYGVNADAPTTGVKFGVQTSLADGITPLLISGGAGVGAVPEPESWVLLIAGFGMVGFSARRRRTATVTA